MLVILSGTLHRKSKVASGQVSSEGCRLNVQHFPQGRGPGGWESQGSFTELLGIGRALKGVSKDRSGARSEEERDMASLGGTTWESQAGTGTCELSHGQARLAGRRWKARRKGKLQASISALSQARELDFLPQAEENH